MNYDNRLCGLGKTADAFKKINSSKTPAIYVTPSVELADNSRNTSNPIHIAKKFALIHHQNGDGKSCANQFKNAIISTSTSGICTTHQTFLKAMMAGTAVNLHHFDLYIDELIDFYAAHRIRFVSETFTPFYDFLDFDPSHNGHVRVTVKESRATQLKNIIDGEKDEFWDAPAPKKFALHLLSACHDTYITNENHKNILSLNSDSDAFQFQAISVITPSALSNFKTVTVLTAGFEKTVAYYLLRLFGHKMKDITPPMIHRSHNKSIQINYVVPNKFSASKRDTVCKDGKTVGEKIAAFQNKMLSNERFLYNANENLRSIYSSNGTLINSPYGHNSYTDFFAAAWCMSQLPTEWQTLISFGVPKEAIYAEKNYLLCYQHIMRTSLRTNASEIVKVYVPDKKTAEFLSDFFPKAELIPHILPDVYTALGKGVQKQSAVPAVARNTKSKFEKKYKECKINPLTFKDKNRITATKKYIKIMRKYYKDISEFFDFDAFLKKHNI